VNGIPTPVIQILAQYYKAILLPFEEWNRKNAQQQQRAMSGVQGQAGQPVPVGQHGMPGQMPGGDLGTQTVVPPTIPHIDGGSGLPPHHPFPSSSQTHRQQPSASINMLPSGSSLQAQPDMLSGISSNISQPFLPQASPPDGSQVAVQGQAQDDAALPDAEGRKRKGTAEGDVKRVRQRTGMGLNYPIMVRIKNLLRLQSILQIQSRLVVFRFDTRRANKVAISPTPIALLFLRPGKLRAMGMHQRQRLLLTRHSVERLNTSLSFASWIRVAVVTCAQSRTGTTV